MIIKRIYDNLAKYLKPNKVLVIYGPRQAGKTTLLNNFLKNTGLKYKLDSGDNIGTRAVLSSEDFDKIKEYAADCELLVIDEAQRVPKVGLGLKIIVDQIPGIKVIVTGSSSFELRSQIGEPLTGRKRTLLLYPVAQIELLAHYNRYELKQRLEDFLIFGSYPSVVAAETRNKKREIAEELAEAYLLKDVLALEKIKGEEKLWKLLRLLAFQVGQEVSQNEIATQLGISVPTVGRYLDLLGKSFVIFPLGSYSRNLRNEVTGKRKYYFFDNGIRNAVISQFNHLEKREDVGKLCENFIVVERLKKRAYKNIYGQSYFWRTYGGQEIDLVEERDGKIWAYECKWSPSKKVQPPKEWLKNYPKTEFKVINNENYLDFIL